ncbi:zinc finger protein 3-like [Copidosoma floridanum]|uniref:zinc finger protein 3-like n=1 Tax=Copidosoma floridanum TaxID=29053 RepID=UPI000C6FB9DF|nr:zinc finger protein 3-like [Copidosoma floridanum]
MIEESVSPIGYSLSDLCNRISLAASESDETQNLLFTMKTFQCLVCDKTFKQKSHFLTHMCTHVGKLPDYSQIIGNLYPTNQTSQASFTPSMNQQSIVPNGNFTQDTPGHQLNLNYFSGVSQTFIHMSGFDTSLACHQCLLYFEDPDSHKHHKLVHHFYSCPLCPLSFAQGSDVSTHMASQHCFPCDTCPGICTTSYDLVNHKREVHGV